MVKRWSCFFLLTVHWLVSIPPSDPGCQEPRESGTSAAQQPWRELSLQDGSWGQQGLSLRGLSTDVIRLFHFSLLTLSSMSPSLMQLMDAVMLQLTRARNRLTTPASMTLPELATSGLMVHDTRLWTLYTGWSNNLSTEYNWQYFCCRWTSFRWCHGCWCSCASCTWHFSDKNMRHYLLKHAKVIFNIPSSSPFVNFVRL